MGKVPTPTIVTWIDMLCSSLRVERKNYLNTFEFLDKLAENLDKKQKE